MEEFVKIEIEIPKKAYEFAEFYANICNKPKDALLKKALMERLKELRNKLRALPHVSMDEVRDRWDIN